ncbi:MAG TPA: hypothetical protein VK636_13870 [Gemmatimonadaceae bacterium]|nr:hypothetical protein [Gemmatimonadaceae bacterium]
MVSSTHSVLAALAVLPGKEAAPRVIQQFTSVFLVSGRGEMWRVFDCAAPNGQHVMPSAHSTLPVRIFLSLGRSQEVRARTFGAHEPRDIDPVSLQTQLEEAGAV